MTTTAIVTTAPATVAPLTWTTKNGATRRADSATAQTFAPRAARLSAAQAADLSALKNGQFRPFMASVRASLTKAEMAALVAAPDFSANPTKKAQVLDSLRAIEAEWVRSAAAQEAKGKKPAALRRALHETLSAWLDHEATTAALKAAGMDGATDTGADTAPGADSTSTDTPATGADTGTDTAPADTAAPVVSADTSEAPAADTDTPAATVADMAPALL